MKTVYSIFILFFMSIPMYGQIKTAMSPGKKVTLSVYANYYSQIEYSIMYNNREVIQKSTLGMITNQGILGRNLRIISIDTITVDETWQPVLGEVKKIRNHYKQLVVKTRENTDNQPKEIHYIFRIYDDGVGFRYYFPPQPHLKNFVVNEEDTQFNLTGDHKAWWIPADYDTNEYPYTTSLLSEVSAYKVRDKHTEISTRVVKNDAGVATPLMLKTSDGLYINIHEAALVNYPAMQLEVKKAKNSLVSKLVPDPVGNKAYLETPFSTPWRTIIISDKATDILASNIILNLNEPCVIPETSWIKPFKMIGIWWAMHIGTASWDYAGNNETNGWKDPAAVKPSGRHGATTENTKKYIDFAAKHGIDAVLVEGWNIGWENWFGQWKEDVFDFVTPYPDFDIAEVNRYAASKNVKIVMHHETSASVTNYERRMDEAYKLMKKYGYDAVKTGYVGKIIPRGEHHDGQWMINHYNRVAEKTAKEKIMVDMHESVRPTGMHRTYPNWLANEAARGNEFNAWSMGNAPEHETILPFTRLMGGPMDYTPGIFQIKLDKYGKTDHQVHTTLVKQLALYVTMYSPIQMAADLPENYEAHPEAFQFIKDVAIDWDDSRYLEAEPGDFVTVARKAKGKEDWFIGGITDEQKRTAVLTLDFLNKNENYVMTLYKDGPDAHWENKPDAYVIEKYIVDHKTKLQIALAEGGGFAASIFPATANDVKKFKKY